MNWYKTAQNVSISITSYNASIGELGISFNGGKTYLYPNVSPFLYNKIKVLLNNKNYKKVQNILKNLSDNKNKETKEDKDKMLNQLYEEGYLK